MSNESQLLASELPDDFDPDWQSPTKGYDNTRAQSNAGHLWLCLQLAAAAVQV
jgi:hypothetical protein